MITIRSNSTQFSRSLKSLARKYPQAVRAANYDAALEALTLFEKTVATWTDKPGFTAQPTHFGYRVGTDNEVYGYVDEGTHAHTIAPRQANILRWTGPFRAKTRPNVIGSTGGSRGSKVSWAHKVRHPGIQARNFSKVIRERVQPKMARYVREELHRIHASEGVKLQ